MDVFVAVADPVRRSLLQQLASGGPQRVVDLAAGRGISRPAISRHLRVLGEAGLVRGADVGRERHYDLDPAPLTTLTDFAAALRDSSRAAPVTDTMLDALDLEVRRTGREGTATARRASARTTRTTTQEETA